MNVGKTKSAYFLHVDGLRAMAVLAVILYHLHPAWLPGGFSGVDIFFVISGFVVSASVRQFNHLDFPGFLLHFYARRVQRIVPALMVCLVLTSIISALFIPSAWLSYKNQTTGLAAFFGFSNFILSQTGNDYFSPTAEFNPYTHTWSLCVEEQFYLIFPMIFFPWMTTDKGRKLSHWLFGGGAVFSIGVALWLGRSNGSLAFYMIASRFWELAAGVMLYQFIALLPRRPVAQARPILFLFGVLGSTTLVTFGFVFSNPASFPFPGALPAVLGTLGLLYFLHGSNPHGPSLRLFTNPLAVFLGKISYSLYLWHWPVFVLFKWTFGMDSVLCRILAVLTAFFLALMSYYLVENKIRDFAALKNMSRGHRLIAGVGLILASFSISSIIVKIQPNLSLSTVSRHVQDWDTHLSQVNVSYNGCTINSEQQVIPGNKILLLTRKNCTLTASQSGRLFVIGDSHAGHYNLMLRQFTLQTGAPVYVYSTGGCAFLSLREPMAGSELCRNATDSALNDLLSRVRPGDILILSSLRINRFGDQWIKYDESVNWFNTFGAHALIERKAAENQAIGMLDNIASKGIQIVFPAPTPIFRSPAFRCSDWFNKYNPICSYGDEIAKNEIDRYRDPVLQSFSRIAKAVPGVKVWDPMPILCPGPVCKASRGGSPLFFDGDHLSAFSNGLLLPDFSRFIASLQPKA